MQHHTFALPDDQDPGALLEDLSGDFQLVRDRGATTRETYLDSFDWRLYRSGRILAKTRNGYSLVNLGHTPGALSGQATVGNPRFWQDFSEGPLQDALRAGVGIRALMRLVSVRRRTHWAHVLNPDEKTVLRLMIEEIDFVRGGKLHPAGRIVGLQPLRGYGQEADRVANRLRAMEFEVSTEDAVPTALRAAGLEPGGYSSKFSVQLTRDLSAREAARRILELLAGVIGVNEQGIREDVDAEFLHDYRVSVRRTRSALAQFKGVFASSEVERFARLFRDIGKMTNRPRDLDVYLLKQDDYRAMLTSDLAGGLDPVFSRLKRERTREYRKLRRALSRDCYADQMTEWLGFLGAPASDEAPQAGKPAAECASKWIRRRHKKVIKSGGKLTDASPDPEFHKLRIQCKKLRYLMEFFSSLYPDDAVQNLIAQLKRLQDNLGDYNDLAVQQGELRMHLDDLRKADSPDLTAAAAIGGLIATLGHRQKRVRRAFRTAFGTFSGRENRRLFAELFAVPGSEGG